MPGPPEFLQSSPAPPLPKRYLPLPASRRGEGLAWLCALGSAAASGGMVLRLGTLPGAAMAISLFFFFAAGLISFGNWMERNTSIVARPGSLAYHNPLRSLELTWEAIRSLSALPSSRGWRIAVYADGSGFTFRTESSLSFGAFGQMAHGIREGKELAALICKLGCLGALSKDDRAWHCRKAPS